MPYEHLELSPVLEEPFTALPAAAANKNSAIRLQGLVEVASELQTDMPGYLGMTGFGSTVRGAAREDSDVDVFVFLDPDTSEGKDVHELHRRGDNETAAGTYLFNRPSQLAYEMVIQQHLLNKNIDRFGVNITPLNERIANETTEYLLQRVEQYEKTHEGGAVVPRNIRGLFHAPVDTAQLQPYRQQVLEQLAQSPHGEMAWKMIRYLVAAFEVGRDQVSKYQQDGTPLEVSHRELPDTLQGAVAFYLGSKPIQPASE